MLGAYGYRYAQRMHDRSGGEVTDEFFGEFAVAYDGAATRFSDRAAALVFLVSLQSDRTQNLIQQARQCRQSTTAIQQMHHGA
jgi:hypothetical protein